MLQVGPRLAASPSLCHSLLTLLQHHRYTCGSEEELVLNAVCTLTNVSFYQCPDSKCPDSKGRSCTQHGVRAHQRDSLQLPGTAQTVRCGQSLSASEAGAALNATASRQQPFRSLTVAYVQSGGCNQCNAHSTQHACFSAKYVLNTVCL
eukprot:scaffold19605_cov23-Tisochrysis_lutea.AAC.5